jgi:hypothetical protein
MKSNYLQMNLQSTLSIIRFLLFAVLLANASDSIATNARIAQGFDTTKSIYSVNFVNNNFHAHCRDTSMIRIHNGSMRIRSTQNKYCEILIDSNLDFEPDGMRFNIIDSQMILHSNANNDSIVLLVREISSVRQNIEYLKGEPSIARKSFKIVAGILIPTAVLVGILYVMMINTME